MSWLCKRTDPSRSMIGWRKAGIFTRHAVCICMALVSRRSASVTDMFTLTTIYHIKPPHMCLSTAMAYALGFGPRCGVATLIWEHAAYLFGRLPRKAIASPILSWQTTCTGGMMIGWAVKTSRLKSFLLYRPSQGSACPYLLKASCMLYQQQ